MGKTKGLHESFEQNHHLKTSSNRSFGITVGGIVVLISIYRIASTGELDGVSTILLAVGGLLLIAGIGFADVLAPLNRAWTRLGLVLFHVVNPVIMAVMFYLTLVPFGIAMRLTGRDALKLKWNPQTRSYWIERSPPGPRPETMKQQF